MISRIEITYNTGWSKQIIENLFKQYRNKLSNDIYSKRVALK